MALQILRIGPEWWIYKGLSTCYLCKNKRYFTWDTFSGMTGNVVNVENVEMLLMAMWEGLLEKNYIFLNLKDYYFPDTNKKPHYY